MSQIKFIVRNYNLLHSEKNGVIYYNDIDIDTSTGANIDVDAGYECGGTMD